MLVTITNPPYILFITVFLLMCTSFKQRIVVFNVSEPATAHIHSIFKHDAIWEEWCFYTFKDGSVSKKYLATMNTSTTNYMDINRAAAQECF